MTWEIHLQAVARKMQVDFEEIIKHTRHPGIVGSNREEIVRKFLELHLPAIYEVGTGEIVDSFGNSSKQCDIVISNKFWPVLRTFENRIYPVEAVLATVEVKSTLTSTTLKDAILNARSVKRCIKKFAEDDAVLHKNQARVYATLFGFQARGLRGVMNSFSRLNKELAVPPGEQIDLVHVLNKGCVANHLHIEVDDVPVRKDNLALFENPASSLFEYLSWMLDFSNPTPFLRCNISSYSGRDSKHFWKLTIVPDAEHKKRLKALSESKKRSEVSLNDTLRARFESTDAEPNKPDAGDGK